MLLEFVLDLEVWLAHFYEGFAVRASGDHAPVIIRQHHDGSLGQVRTEHTLTARVEAVVLGLDKS